MLDQRYRHLLRLRRAQPASRRTTGRSNELPPLHSVAPIKAEVGKQTNSIVIPGDDASQPVGSDYGPGRDEDCSSPPGQIPAGAANAPGSSLGFWRRNGVEAVGVAP